MKVSAGGVKSRPYSSWKNIRDPENQMHAAAFMMLESLLTVVAPGMIIYLGRLQVSELSEWLNKWNMTESMLSPSCRITYSWACAENEKNPSGLVQITMKLSPSPLLEIALPRFSSSPSHDSLPFLRPLYRTEPNHFAVSACLWSEFKKVHIWRRERPLSLFGDKGPVADWSHSSMYFKHL